MELATLKGKILVFGANDPYTSFSSSQGSCANKRRTRGSPTQALVCSLGPLAPGQSAQIHATIRVRESAVQSTTLLPKTGENEYSDAVKSNDAGNQPFYLDVPPKVSGSKLLKLIGLPQGCVTGDFTLTASLESRAQTKKMKINADLGFNRRTATTWCSAKQVNGRQDQDEGPGVQGRLPDRRRGLPHLQPDRQSEARRRSCRDDHDRIQALLSGAR